MIPKSDIDNYGLALQNEKTFRLLVSAVQDYAIFMLTPAGYIATWNEGAQRIKGYYAPEVIGQHFSIFYPREAIETDFPAYELKMATENGSYTDEGWRIRKDGSRFWANVVITAIHDEDGTLVGFSKVTRDLTEQKEAEEALVESRDTLQKRTNQLENLNQELEAFCYSVSHDLRAPLRSLDGYSLALLEDYADQLDSEGQHFLNRIRASSQKMAELIDALLNLSQISRTELSTSQVNLSDIVTDIVQELQELEPERRVELKVEPSLHVNGDIRMMKILLQNLLDNAWKFTKGREPAVIEFGRCPNQDRPTFFIRDNGAGFNMDYVNKLFGAFQRLHGSEFPGTGIGLATVQRILNRHDGHAWAEGTVGEGATFYFQFRSRLTSPQRVAQ